jgi:hypothetical protein
MGNAAYPAKKPPIYQLDTRRHCGDMQTGGTKTVFKCRPGWTRCNMLTLECIVRGSHAACGRLGARPDGPTRSAQGWPARTAPSSARSLVSHRERSRFRDDRGFK